MGGIEAKAQPFRGLYSVENRSELVQAMPQAGALSGGIFQRDAHGSSLGCPKDLVQASHDLLEPRLFSRAAVGPGMHHQKRQAEIGGELNFLNHCRNTTA